MEFSANTSEVKTAHQLIDRMAFENPKKLEVGQYFLGDKGYDDTIRIPLSEDRRIFTPVARSSYKWKKIYKQRTTLERINSRIDNVFGFENHTIRGIKKMRIRVTIAFIIMQSFAIIANLFIKTLKFSHNC